MKCHPSHSLTGILALPINAPSIPTHTLRVHYSLEGMKNIIQVYEGEINGHVEKEGLPTEYQYEFEQEMLKHVHELKKDLREKGWKEGESPEVSQTSFLRSEDCDAELGFKFE